MCKKSKFPLVFNIFLAFFITLVVTIFVKAGEGALTLGVAADAISNRLTDEGGEVEFSYTLDADQNSILSKNLVKITVRRAGPPA